MHFRGFDLNLLIALDALLREKNVTRAAERVFVSQPAMSLALQKLRDYFDDPLLTRVGRELELTPRGLSLVEPVRETLLRVSATLGTQPVFDPAIAKRDFTVILPDFVVPRLGARMLAHVVSTAPGVRISIQRLAKSGSSRLENGEVDLLATLDDAATVGLDALPDSLCRADLLTIRWVCVMAADHPLAQEEGQLTREQFLSFPHICLQTPGERASLEDIALRQFSVPVDVRATTHSLMEIPFLLSGTRLIAVLPDDLGMQFAKTTGITLVDVPNGMLPLRRVVLFWHRRNESDPGHAWLRNLLLDASRMP